MAYKIACIVRLRDYLVIDVHPLAQWQNYIEFLEKQIELLMQKDRSFSDCQSNILAYNPSMDQISRMELCDDFSLSRLMKLQHGFGFRSFFDPEYCVIEFDKFIVFKFNYIIFINNCKDSSICKKCTSLLDAMRKNKNTP